MTRSSKGALCGNYQHEQVALAETGSFFVLCNANAVLCIYVASFRENYPMDI